MARLEYIPIPLRYFEALQKLDHDQIGIVVLSALEYASTGDVDISGLDVAESMMFWCMKGDIDRVAESIEEKSQKQRERSQKRWDTGNDATASENATAGIKKESKNQRIKEPKNQITKESKNEKNLSDVNGNGVDGRRGRKRYDIPTVDDVTAYCVEIGCETVDPAYFCEYYGKQNWKINGTPVHDWKAILRTWAANDSRKAVPASSSPTSSFDAEEMWADAVAASYADLDYSEDGA